MELDLEQYWTFGLALLIVLILIGILFWIIQKLGVGGGKGRRGSRLGIVEAAVVDRSRRLVLIRRDAVEHLVMIGGPQDVVVETNITKHEPTLSAAARDTGPGGPGFEMRPGAQAAVTADPDSSEPVMAEDHVVRPPVAQSPVAQSPVAQPPVAQPPVVQPVVEDAALEPVVEQPAAPVAAQAAEVPVAEPAPAMEPAAAAAPPPGPEPVPAPAEEPQPQLQPEMVPRRAVEDAPRPAAAPARPWPPSEGRFREAQRRFAERSDYNPPGRGGRNEPAHDMEGHQEPERQIANRAAPDGMPPPEPPREVSHEGTTREPANLNVRPGEDR